MATNQNEVTEEQLELARVFKALDELVAENYMWETNMRKFSKLSHDHRVWWWSMFKKQAEAGAPAPRALLTKVIALRITG